MQRTHRLSHMRKYQCDSRCCADSINMTKLFVSWYNRFDVSNLIWILDEFISQTRFISQILNFEFLTEILCEKSSFHFFLCIALQTYFVNDLRKKRLLCLIFFFHMQSNFSFIVDSNNDKKKCFFICNERIYFIRDVLFKFENDNNFLTKQLKNTLNDIRVSKIILHWFLWFQLVSIVINI